MAPLPDEILDQIIDEAVDMGQVRPPPVRSSLLPNSMASTPPSSGACPFMQVPAEVRRLFFAASLPDRDAVAHPICANYGDAKHPKNRPELPLGKRTWPPNAVADLMVLNRQICDEVTEIMYEERFFVIHVHLGLRHGGVELMSVGRQPLQWMDEISDKRFLKFQENNQFGFHRLKKIVIQIYPSHEDNGRHTAVHAYFMNLALVKLLSRSIAEPKDRIKNITIEFMAPQAVASERQGRAAIQRAEQPWWDIDKQMPRETSIHNVSDVILVLHPFANLTRCHAVDVKLPPHVRDHSPTVDWVSKLEASMKNDDRTLPMEDDLERYLEPARYAMEDYVLTQLHGHEEEFKDVKKFHDVPGLTEEDIEEDRKARVRYNWADDMEDDEKPSKKHGLSPVNTRNGGGTAKRHQSLSRMEAGMGTVIDLTSDEDDEINMDNVDFHQQRWIERMIKTKTKEMEGLLRSSNMEVDQQMLDHAIRLSLQRSTPSAATDRGEASSTHSFGQGYGVHATRRLWRQAQYGVTTRFVHGAGTSSDPVDLETHETDTVRLNQNERFNSGITDGTSRNDSIASTSSIDEGQAAQRAASMPSTSASALAEMSIDSPASSSPAPSASAPAAHGQEADTVPRTSQRELTSFSTSFSTMMPAPVTTSYGQQGAMASALSRPLPPISLLDDDTDMIEEMGVTRRN